jgi:hypothetical protein
MREFNSDCYLLGGSRNQVSIQLADRLLTIKAKEIPISEEKVYTNIMTQRTYGFTDSRLLIFMPSRTGIIS